MYRSSTRGPRSGRTIAICFALSVSALAACGSSDDGSPAPTATNVRPTFLGTVTTATYDGTSDDLLTAGLGWDGLQSATPPALSATPTASELRRRAIYSNYRALVDITTAGGYGVLFGPNVPVDGGAPNTTPGAGKIARHRISRLQRRRERHGRGDIDGADPFDVQSELPRAS